MKTLGKLKLNQLSKVELDKRELNLFRGGGSCPTECGTCGCFYENNGGSSSAGNQSANAAAQKYSPCVDDYDPAC